MVPLHSLEKAIIEKVNSKYSLFDIAFSYNCNLHCLHCLYGSDLKNKNTKMKNENIYKYLDEAIKFGKFNIYSFGDQEIFFNLNKFIEIAQYLRRKVKNSEITITTSSFWVKNYEYTVKQLLELKTIGLKSILFSIDDFHLRTIEIGKVITCVKASLDIGLEISLQTIIGKNTRKKEDFKYIFKKALSSYNIDKLDWVEHNFTPVGNAASIDKKEYIIEENILMGSCSIMEILQITPEGNVIPCCGSGSTAKYLSIGNLINKRLYDISKDAEADALINSLFIWLGPYSLLNLVKNSRLSNTLSKKHTGICHACYEIFSNKKIINYLNEKLQNSKINLMATRWYLEKKYKSKKNLKREEVIR